MPLKYKSHNFPNQYPSVKTHSSLGEYHAPLFFHNYITYLNNKLASFLESRMKELKNSLVYFLLFQRGRNQGQRWIKWTYQCLRLASAEWGQHLRLRIPVGSFPHTWPCLRNMRTGSPPVCPEQSIVLDS